MKMIKNILFILWELIKTAVLTLIIYCTALLGWGYAFSYMGDFGSVLGPILICVLTWFVMYIHASRYFSAKAENGAISLKDVDISPYIRIRRRNMRVWAFPLFGMLILLLIGMFAEEFMIAAIYLLIPLIPVFGAAAYSFFASRVEMYEIKRSPESYKSFYADKYKREISGAEIYKNICYAAALVIIPLIAYALYSIDNPHYRYEGHGFKYMHGYSSTDFKGYYVYSFPSKLAKLGHKSSFIIENEADMPVLDGAEACYPLYSAVAKTVYKDIAKIEKKYYKMFDGYNGYDIFNGKIVTFSNSSVGYDRLIDGEADIMFGARPSQAQKERAAEKGVHIISVPVAKEAFVFFVEKENPITDISSEDLRKIYSGEIKNWNELCDYNREIAAFQRPENAGSQVMMRYFMGDTELMEPRTYAVLMSMEGIVQEVAQYADDKGALGYSFRYFVEELGQEKNVKILSVDGVAPTLENIENGTYPVLADLVCARLAENKKENVDKMIDFMLSEDGKTLIRKTGYAPVKGSERKEIEEAAPVTEETT